jgi:hypothetical protein
MEIVIYVGTTQQVLVLEMEIISFILVMVPLETQVMKLIVHYGLKCISHVWHVTLPLEQALVTLVSLLVHKVIITLE